MVVDDDTIIANIVKTVAEKLSCSVQCIHNGEEVGTAFVAFKPDVIFLDLVLPGIDGVEIIRILSKAGCSAKIVLMSGLDERTLSSVSEMARKNNLDLTEAVSKPFAPGQLEGILRPLITLNDKPPLADDIAEDLPVFGPIVLFEPELSLENNGPDLVKWVRAKLNWLMDDNHPVDFDNILTEAASPKMAKGLIQFILMEAAKNENLFRSGQNLGIKLPIHDDLLKDDTIPDYLERIVKQYLLSNQHIMLEVSESAVLSSVETTFDVLARLKIKGFKLAVCVRDKNDQVLGILKELPVDELVIDMEGEGYRDNAITTETEFQIGSLMSYAASAGLTTSAKNVYSEKQNSFIRQCRLAKASGHYISEPKAGAAVLDFYAQYH